MGGSNLESPALETPRLAAHSSSSFLGMVPRQRQGATWPCGPGERRFGGGSPGPASAAPTRSSSQAGPDASPARPLQAARAAASHEEGAGPGHAHSALLSGQALARPPSALPGLPPHSSTAPRAPRGGGSPAPAFPHPPARPPGLPRPPPARALLLAGTWLREAGAQEPQAALHRRPRPASAPTQARPVPRPAASFLPQGGRQPQAARQGRREGGRSPADAPRKARRGARRSQPWALRPPVP